MREASVILESAITCPHCGFQAVETMPTNACQYFYECKGCGTLLRPKPGDCCVFCSFGSIPCPPIQAEGGKGGCCPPARGAAG
ncbi:GDCCVxC domain-containing (seleno)protein [Acidocella aquatica]|uniref:GDCCVxC domain-containing (seleno)protein n=1 Tax=Acidocella aquatica TaxID=1922313 RepID=UPI0024E19687|nr:GDCCVxC domain-containing (seleno)protein [Acidocella aquatica]